MTSLWPGRRPSRRWLEAALILYWPVAYFGIYLPLMVPYEAWGVAAVTFWFLAFLFLLGLAVVGWSASTAEVLLISVAITAGAALFTALAGGANAPGFRKGPDDLSEAVRYALPLGGMATAAMLAAKGANLLIRRRGLKSAA